MDTSLPSPRSLLASDVGNPSRRASFNPPSAVSCAQRSGRESLANWSEAELEWYCRHEPELFWAERYPWQLYVGLSLPKARLLPHARRKYLHMWLRCLAKRHRLHFRDDLVHIFRLERAPGTWREHFHGLIGGLPATASLKAESRWLAETWLQQTGAIAEVAPYHRELVGVAYILKRDRVATHLQRANSDDCAPMLSPAFSRLILELHAG